MEILSPSVILHLLFNYVVLLVCVKSSSQEANATANAILNVHVIGVFRTNNSYGFMEAIKSVKKKLRKTIHVRVKGVVVQQGDDEDITTVARAVCKKISKRRVIVAVVSDQQSKSLQLMAYIMGQHMIPILGPTSQEAILSRKDVHPSFLRLVPPLSQQSHVITSILEKLLLFDRFVILARGNKIGLAIIHELQAIAISKEWNPILTVTLSDDLHHQDEKDILPILYKIKSLPTYAIVLHCTSKEAKLIFTVAKRLKILNKYIWIGTSAVAENLQSIDLFPKSFVSYRLKTPLSKPNTSFNLIEDAVSVISKGLLSYNSYKSDYRRYAKTLGEACSCEAESACDSSSQISKVEFLRSLKNISFHGKSGFVEFDENGDRKSMEYVLVYSRKDALGNAGLVTMGTWDRTNGIDFQDDWHIDMIGTETNPLLKLMRRRIVRVTTILEEPFTMYHDNLLEDGTHCDKGLRCTEYVQRTDAKGMYTYSTKTHCCVGMMIDILVMLKDNLYIDTEIHIVKDGKYGSIVNSATNTWNGMINEILTGEAELALAILTVTEQRSQVVDFTDYFWPTGISIVVSELKEDRPIFDMSFLNPFSKHLWLAVFATIISFAVLIWCMDTVSPYGNRLRCKTGSRRRISRRCRNPRGNGRVNNKFTPIESALHAWSVYFRVNGFVKILPKSAGVRVTSIAFGAAMLILSNSYTANLSASLIVDEYKYPTSGIRDPKMVNPPEYFRFATTADSSVESFFRWSNDANFRRIYRNMKPHRIRNISEGVSKVKSGKLQAFLASETILQYFAARQSDCSLKLVGQAFGWSGFALALAKNSPLQRRLSQIIRENREIIGQMYHKWIPGTCLKPQKLNVINVNQLSGLFLVVLICIMLSSWLMIGEFLLRRYCGNAPCFHGNSSSCCHSNRKESLDRRHVETVSLQTRRKDEGCTKAKCTHAKKPKREIVIVDNSEERLVTEEEDIEGNRMLLLNKDIEVAVITSR